MALVSDVKKQGKVSTLVGKCFDVTIHHSCPFAVGDTLHVEIRRQAEGAPKANDGEWRLNGIVVERFEDAIVISNGGLLSLFRRGAFTTDDVPVACAGEEVLTSISRSSSLSKHPRRVRRRT